MRIDIDSLVRRTVLNLKPYRTARDEFQGKGTVFLDANENPTERFGRYPDPRQISLKHAIAKIKNVQESAIILGNGSDEIIDLLLRAFCEPGIDNVIIPQPTYGMYEVCARVNGIEIRTSNLTEAFDVDVNDILKKVDSKTKLIFLCSPNNPTGNLLSLSGIKTLMSAFKGLVVVDEAYIDFSSGASLVSEIEITNNLVVIQTFSKAWGIAGLRLGAGFANERVIDALTRIKLPYNINAYTQQYALEILTKKDYLTSWVNHVRKERIRMTDTLNNLNCVSNVYPSEANFLLVKFFNVKEVFQYLLSREIVVRSRHDLQGCENCLRITLGRTEENNKLIKALLDYEKDPIY